MDKEIEITTIVREKCEKCGGTGLVHKPKTYECDVCKGRGMVKVSETKVTKNE